MLEHNRSHIRLTLAHRYWTTLSRQPNWRPAFLKSMALMMATMMFININVGCQKRESEENNYAKTAINIFYKKKPDVFCSINEVSVKTRRRMNCSNDSTLVSAILSLNRTSILEVQVPEFLQLCCAKHLSSTHPFTSCLFTVSWTDFSISDIRVKRR